MTPESGSRLLNKIEQVIQKIETIEAIHPEIKACDDIRFLLVDLVLLISKEVYQK